MIARPRRGWGVAVAVIAATAIGCVDSRLSPCGDLTCPANLVCDLVGPTGPRCVSSREHACGNGQLDVGEECDCGATDATLARGCARPNGGGFAAECSATCQIRAFGSSRVYAFPLDGMWASRAIIAGYKNAEGSVASDQVWILADGAAEMMDVPGHVVAVAGVDASATLLTDTWTVYRWDGGWTSAALGEPAPGVRALGVAVDDGLWVATGDAVYRHDGAGWQADAVPATRLVAERGRLFAVAPGSISERVGGEWRRLTDGLTSTTVRRDVAAAPDGTLWIAHDAGLTHLGGAPWPVADPGPYVDVAVTDGGGVFALYRDRFQYEWLRRITEVGAFKLDDRDDSVAYEGWLATDGDELWFGNLWDGVYHMPHGVLSSYSELDGIGGVEALRALDSGLWAAGRGGVWAATPPTPQLDYQAYEWKQVLAVDAHDVCQTSHGIYATKRRSNTDPGGPVCRLDAQTGTCDNALGAGVSWDSHRLWCHGDRVAGAMLDPMLGPQVTTWRPGSAPVTTSPGVQIDGLTGDADGTLYLIGWRAPGTAVVLREGPTGWTEVYADATADRFVAIVVDGDHIVVAGQRQVFERLDGNWSIRSVAPVQPRTAWRGDDGAIYLAGTGGVARGWRGTWTQVALAVGDWRLGASFGSITVLSGLDLVHTYIPNTPATPSP